TCPLRLPSAGFANEPLLGSARDVPGAGRIGRRVQKYRTPPGSGQGATRSNDLGPSPTKEEPIPGSAPVAPATLPGATQEPFFGPTMSSGRTHFSKSSALR